MSEPKENVIKMAETLLRMARTGEVRGFSAAIIAGGHCQWMRVGDYEATTMVGALVVAQGMETDDIADEMREMDGRPAVKIVDEDSE